MSSGKDGAASATKAKASHAGESHTAASHTAASHTAASHVSAGARVERFQRGTRSYTMSHIRGKDTSIEVMVRRYLFSRGLRFRKNDRRYPGHPDVVLPRWRAIVFVNGCFWHMHEGCPKCVIPKSNVDFWTAKLIRNRERDARQIAGLERDGWRVFVVWECELGRAMRTCTLDALHARIVGGWVPSASDGRATVRIPSSVE